MASPASGRTNVRRNWRGFFQADSHRSQASCSRESTRPSVAMAVVAAVAVGVRGREEEKQRAGRVQTREGSQAGDGDGGVDVMGDSCPLSTADAGRQGCVLACDWRREMMPRRAQGYTCRGAVQLWRARLANHAELPLPILAQPPRSPTGLDAIPPTLSPNSHTSHLTFPHSLPPNTATVRFPAKQS